MPSPFPGMNPYLEQVDVWHDFHQGFVAHLRDAVAPQIRPKYLAKIDENVYIHELSAEERHLLGRPDVAVLSNQPGTRGTAVVDRAAPAYGHLLPQADELRESFVEIRDRESRELITVIEVLSPTNKERGADRDQYVAKRRCILASHAHLVEIDLLRGHERMPVKDMPSCDYVVMVSRYQERPRVGLWPINLRDRLPEIPIPLKYGDPDATLDLQSVLNNLYDAAGYEDYIYRGKPQPPLGSEDATWAKSLFAGRP